jgi:MtN3 and saliva related transmembrane protein
MDATTIVGLAAAFCTTVSYYPQLKKCWDTGSAGDLSLKMFLTLSVGVALWAVYGFLRSGVVIIINNSISLALLMGILYFKLREHREHHAGLKAPRGRLELAPGIEGLEFRKDRRRSARFNCVSDLERF